MNNESGDFAAEPVDTDSTGHDASYTTGVEAPGRSINLETPRTWARKKRLEFLDDLIRTLDVLAYAQISTVYYLDNSFLRFALRSMVQLVYLMPTSSILPDPPTQPYIGGVVGTNLVCLGCHLWFPKPEAGEAARGYLHGGLLLDFVGQLGPSSKLRLVLLDMFILLLQLIALAATVKRRSMGKLKPPTATRASRATSDSAVATLPGQDHDAEERGLLRRSLSPSTSLSSRPEGSASGLASRTPPSGRTNAMADLLASGQAVIAELYVWDTLRDQHNAYVIRALSSRSSTTALNPEFAAALRQRRWPALNVPFRS